MQGIFEGGLQQPTADLPKVDVGREAGPALSQCRILLK